MEDLQKLRIIYKLKEVYRNTSITKRKESSAEHTWSCLMLADFFLSQCQQKINRLKVYELLMYHDLVEIEVGDTPLNHSLNNRTNKFEKEQEGMERLSKKLPKPINNKFKELFNEFEEKNTLEAKFAKAIDKLDATIHEIDYKEDWKEWTKELLMEHSMSLFEEFPTLKKYFLQIVDFLEDNDYFKK